MAHEPNDPYVAPSEEPVGAPGAPGVAGERGRFGIGAYPAAIRRVSWGAIFGGAVVALMVQLALNLLGLGIGFGAIDVTEPGQPLQGLGVGTGIWLIVSTILSLFVGGWTAGRLAGLPRRTDAILHGFVTWAVVTFFTFYLVSSGISSVIGGAFSVVEQGAQLLGRGVGAVAPQAGQLIEQELGGEISLQQIQQEVGTILQQTGKEELQPENLEERARQIAQGAEGAAADAARTPEDAAQEVRNALDRLISQAGEVASETDREAVVNVLVARTDMTEEQARETVQQYEQVAQQARQQLAALGQNIGQTARQSADDVLNAMSAAAFWGFIAMVLGAAAAAGGGALGTPRDMPASPAVRRE